MAATKLYFKNKDGQTLSAKIEFPINRKPIAYALFAHCFTCNKNLSAIRNISGALTRNGIGVMRFDFTGLGESEGEFADTNFSSNVSDLAEAAHAMAEKFESPKLLIGHSLGGAAVVFASAQIDSVQALVTIGTPSSPDHVKQLLRSSIEEIDEKKIAEVNIGGRNFKIKKQFLEDLSSKRMTDALNGLKKSLLVMHSPQDRIVSIDHAAALYQNARHPKSFVSLDGADHLLSDKNDSDYVGEVIAGWSRRYLRMDKKAKLQTSKQVGVQIGEEKYTTDIVAGRHAMRADEPISVGGNDFGPSPYDLLLASVGACTAMTLRMYADRKKWDIREISVHLSHKKDYAEDCADCHSPSARIDHIVRCIEFSGNLDEKQKSRLLHIADKCPVHKTLHNQVHIKTELLN